MADVLVPLSGIIAALGGLSVALGYRARWGAWLLVVFLVPVTFMMHAFWKETDPQAAQMQMANFAKNLSLLGAALFVALLRRRTGQHRRAPGALTSPDQNA